MQRIKLVALTAVIAMLVVFALGAGNVVNAVNSAIQNVFVTNTAANPVPVSGAVAVNNLPATQAVSGTVKVDNLPATQPVSGTVNVGNFPAVQDDNPARSPFAASVPFAQFSPEGHELTVDLGTVSAGKRLVVEQVSVEVQGSASDSDTQRMRASLETIAGGTASHYSFIGADGGAHPDFSTVEIFVASARMRSYADAGTAVQVVVDRKFTEGCPCPVSVSLSGYLVNVP